MKKTIISLGILVSLSAPTYADIGYVKGKVKNARIHSADLENWEPPLFWFTLDGVAGAGKCPTWHGDVLFVGDSSQAMSFVLATYTSGKELAVRYDDSLKINGWCTAVYATLGGPAPLH